MRRVALYADGDGSGLVRCARAAKARGERVVAMSAEWSTTPGEGLGGPTLRRLMDRMQSGEFDCILADLRSGDGAEQGVVVRFDTAPISGGGGHLDRGGQQS